jgi:hypothetical protein
MSLVNRSVRAGLRSRVIRNRSWTTEERCTTNRNGQTVSSLVMMIKAEPQSACKGGSQDIYFSAPSDALAINSVAPQTAFRYPSKLAENSQLSAILQPPMTGLRNSTYFGSVLESRPLNDITELSGTAFQLSYGEFKSCLITIS